MDEDLYGPIKGFFGHEITVYFRWMELYSPPELAQGLAELRVVEAGVLVTQPPPRRLGPHHERVHRPLHVDPLLVQPQSIKFIFHHVRDFYEYFN